MDESYRVYWDGLGNRAVILCIGGYPIRGAIFPDEGPVVCMSDDIAVLASGDMPLGCMDLDAATCTYIMKSMDGITVSGNEVIAHRELTDEEERYLASR